MNNDYNEYYLWTDSIIDNIRCDDYPVHLISTLSKRNKNIDKEKNMYYFCKSVILSYMSYYTNRFQHIEISVPPEFIPLINKVQIMMIICEKYANILNIDKTHSTSEEINIILDYVSNKLSKYYTCKEDELFIKSFFCAYMFYDCDIISEVQYLDTIGINHKSLCHCMINAFNKIKDIIGPRHCRLHIMDLDKISLG